MNFVLDVVGWIGTATVMGLLQWRVWQVKPAEVSSAMAWVGIWRACYHGDGPGPMLLRVMSCQAIEADEAFQCLLELWGRQPFSVACGVSMLGVAGMALGAGGCFHLLASICTTIAAGWNLSAVTSNQTIAFLAWFRLPHSLQELEVGAAVYMAIFSSRLLLLTALLPLSYKNPLFPFNARATLLSWAFPMLQPCLLRHQSIRQWFSGKEFLRLLLPVQLWSG
ncbi:claudin-34-like [Narcine bancroftii]|uniref:claudin-34-like n=1 Tax=Narcine bancroftii TaxID=1343680 RepID=UPI0038310DC3